MSRKESVQESQSPARIPTILEEDQRVIKTYMVDDYYRDMDVDMEDDHYIRDPEMSDYYPPFPRQSRHSHHSTQSYNSHQSHHSRHSRQSRRSHHYGLDGSGDDHDHSGDNQDQSNNNNNNNHDSPSRSDPRDCICRQDDYQDEDMEEDLPPYEVSPEMAELMAAHGIKHQHYFDNGASQTLDPRYEYAYETAYHSTVWYKTLYQRFPTYRDMIDYQISLITVPSSLAGSQETTSTTSRKYRTITDKDPLLRQKFTAMARRISPFVQIGTGAVHPDFPTSVLAYNLMTEAQLDAVADFYHQTYPGGTWWLQYPCPVFYKKDMDLDDKRRLMGNFIGIIPPESKLPAEVQMWLAELEEEIMKRAEQNRREEDEKEALRRKMYML